MPRKYSRQRRRSSKKRTKTNKKSKKMRGGVTRKLLTRRKVADLTREIGLGHGGSLNTRIKEFVRPALTNRSIRYAVQDYLAGGARKKHIRDKYGEINNWDVSKVTDMSSMFYNTRAFNQPLNNWNVSNVEYMNSMFTFANSFNQPLNNWNVSKGYMYNSGRPWRKPRAAALASGSDAPQVQARGFVTGPPSVHCFPSAT